MGTHTSSQAITNTGKKKYLSYLNRFEISSNVIIHDQWLPPQGLKSQLTDEKILVLDQDSMEKFMRRDENIYGQLPALDVKFLRNKHEE